MEVLDLSFLNEGNTVNVCAYTLCVNTHTYTCYIYIYVYRYSAAVVFHVHTVIENVFR